MGRKLWPWKAGENVWGMLDTRVSGENGGEKVPVDHEPDDPGEICGEVFGEVDSKRSEEDLPKFCLSMSAGAEALRSHIEELFCLLNLGLLIQPEGKGERK